VTGHVDNVVNTAGDLVVAVLVPAGTVSGGIVAGELLEVGFLERLGSP